jgi:hypothetical protein
MNAGSIAAALVALWSIARGGPQDGDLSTWRKSYAHSKSETKSRQL